MKHSLVSCLAGAALCTGLALGGQAAGLESQIPRVIKAQPDNQAQQVDPDQRELRVIFDQPMAPGGRSVVGGGPLFPRLVGKPRWENERTFVWSLRLEPDHEYWLSINSGSFGNFRGTNGESAAPYPISFRTRLRTPAEEAAAPARRTALDREAVAILKQAVDEDYSYRDLRKVDWEQQFREFSPRLESAGQARRFAELAAQMLAPAQDVHLWLRVEGEIIPSYRRRAAWNVAVNRLPRFVPSWQRRSEVICTGEYGDGIRYLYIGGWPGDARQELEPAYEQLADAAEAGKPLIVDVRANGGGDEELAGEFAACFIERPILYARDRLRRDGRFSPVYERSLRPNRGRPKFRGRVVVLAGAGTVSSCESFVMMMKQVPGCTLLGEPTAGCSGSPRPADLGNGVVAVLPSWQDLRLDGTCLEGQGFAPDIVVKSSSADFEQGDPVLEAALKLLRAGKP